MGITEETTNTIRRTRLSDGVNEYVIDTADPQEMMRQAGSFGYFGFMAEALTNTTEYDRYETLIAVNREWFNFTRMNFPTVEQALAWHEEAVRLVSDGKIATIRSNYFESDHCLWDLDELDRFL